MSKKEKVGRMNSNLRKARIDVHSEDNVA